MEFFDRAGRATAYTTDGTHLFLWSGEPVAYLAEGKVYTFRGRLLGWYENGWLYDLGNGPALFSAGAVGGPVKPIKKVKPVKSVRRVTPLKSVRAAAKVRPVRSLLWSPVADPTYFNQA